MAITDIYVPDVYFGLPGSLVALPWPLGGIVRTPDRLASEFVTGSGVRRISRMLRATRLYELNWDNLRYDTFDKVEKFWLGHMGIGPWALVDPSSINLLTVNQSSATSDRNAVSDWTTAATNHGTPSSNSTTAHIHRPSAPRSLRWQFTVAVTASPTLELSTVYSSWYGVPVVVGKSYVWSAWVKPDGTVDTSIELQAKIQWRDAAGATVGSESTSGTSTVTGWTRLTCIGTAPVGAAYASCRLVGTGATITTGASVYVDEPQLEMNTAVTDWRPGNGVYPVSILGLKDSVPWAATWRSGPQLVLREVA